MVKMSLGMLIEFDGDEWEAIERMRSQLEAMNLDEARLNLHVDESLMADVISVFKKAAKDLQIIQRRGIARTRSKPSGGG
jgi:hypothetical protein